MVNLTSTEKKQFARFPSEVKEMLTNLFTRDLSYELKQMVECQNGEDLRVAQGRCRKIEEQIAFFKRL